MNAPSESLDSDHSGKDSSNSDPTAFDADDLYDAMLADETLPNLPSPINWYLLNAEEAEAEWLELNQWVDQLRRTYSLPISVIPPFWHRHPELLWNCPRCICTGSAPTTRSRPEQDRWPGIRSSPQAAHVSANGYQFAEPDSTPTAPPATLAGPENHPRNRLKTK